MENPLLRMHGMKDSSLDSARKVPSSIAESGVDHKYVYASIFAVLGVASAVWFSLNTQIFLNSLTLNPILWVAAAAICLAVVMILQAALIVSRFWNIVLIVVQSAALLYSFYNGMTLWFLLAVALFLLFVIRGYILARSALDNGMEIKFLKYANKFDTAFFTGLTLFCAVFVVALYQQAGGLTQPGYEMLFRGFETPISYGTGLTITAATPVDTAAHEYVLKQLSTQADFMALSASQKDAVVNQAVKEVENRISTQLNMPIQPKETIGGYTYRLIQAGIDHVNALNLGPLVAFGLLLLGALFVRSFLLFIKIPVLIISGIFYKLLLVTGIITIGTELRPKEVLIIK